MAVRSDSVRTERRSCFPLPLREGAIGLSGAKDDWGRGMAGQNLHIGIPPPPLKRFALSRPLPQGEGEISQYICCPPLMDSVLPVMKPPSSATRNSTARAISSARPSRPTGMRATILASTSVGTAATMSVSI